MNGFSKFNKIKGCNISIDQYFTLEPLTKWSSENDFTIVDTMKLDRISLPNEINPWRNEKKNQPSTYIKKMVMLFSFPMSIKKNLGKKKIVVLSAMHSSVRVTKDKRKKPPVHTFYDQTKGGVGVVDLTSSHQSTRFKSP